MTEINTNYTEVKQNQVVQPQPTSTKPTQAYNNEYRPRVKTRSARDEFVMQHKKNGLFEKLYNKIKNATGIGVGSKKAENAVRLAEQGKISEKKAKETIKDYRNSQANSAQILGDAASIAASLLIYFKARKNIKIGGAKALINEKYYEESAVNSGAKWLHKKWLSVAKSKPKTFFYSIGLATIVGAFAKMFTLQLDRIGSKQFKTSKADFNNLETEEDESAYKFAKKSKRRIKRKENWRNFLSGGINAIMLPITTLGGAFIGVPLYLIGNSLNRYFVGNTNERNKSIESYMSNFANDGVTHTLLAAGAAVPLIKKGRWASVFDTNLQKAVEKVSNAKLEYSKFNKPTTYQELQDIMLGDSNKKVADLIEQSKKQNADMDEIITELTKENIFAVKFKQIMHDESRLTMALKEECPPTRCFQKKDGSWDFSDIQKYVDKTFGNGEYEIEKCLGVGTVAETYLAKGKDGKEVCLKVLKVIDKKHGNVIDAKKIQNDKEKFIELIKKSDKSEKEKEYLLKNLDDLADGISKEVDFNNEMKAAEELSKHTKLANVVKGIKVKDDIYVMERAQGISLESLMNIYAAQSLIQAIKKGGFMGALSTIFTAGTNHSRISRIIQEAEKRGTRGDGIIDLLEKEIERIKAKTPQFDNFNLSNDDIKYLISEYNQVLGEQLSKVEKNGKVIHADIHPGNIFIDLNKMKENVRKQNGMFQKLKDYGYVQHKNGKIFTLIDTGNTVNQTAEQAASFIKLSSFVERGNHKDIAEYMVKGAILPEGMGEEKAIELISEDLKKCFFDLETKIDKMTLDSILDLSSNIMREHNIIPSDTQLNLNKARKSAENSLKELETALRTSRFKDIGTTSVAGAVNDSFGLSSMYKKEQARQERANLKQMTLEQRRKFKNNPNMLKNNSEEYLTYKLKQEKIIEKPKTKIEDDFGDLI